MDAFTNVVHSEKPSYIVLWESGYSNRSHGGADLMIEAITTTINTCRIYFVIPKAGVAQGLYNSGKRSYYSYTFNDGTRDIIAKIEGDVLLGDTTQDGVINLNDAVAIMRNYVGLLKFNEEQAQAAKTVVDGNINLNDE